MHLKLSLEENIKIFKERLPIDESFDIIGRELNLSGTKAYLLFVDGFTKDEIMLRVLEDLQHLPKNEGKIYNVSDYMAKYVGYIEAETFTKIERMETAVLSGNTAIVFENQTEGILIDARTYPARGPAEPDLEKVTRGSRDGLVETIVFNTALIRRRIRDPHLIFEMHQIGTRSKTDIAIAYIDGLASNEILDDLRDRFKNIDVESLVMSEETLCELIYKSKWYNPLPQTRFTERPDVAGANLLEGHVAVLVDNSPAVLLLPTTIFHFSQHAEDYYQNPLVGTYTRWMRFISLFTALFVTPVWLLLVYNVDYLPKALQFFGPREEGVIPLFFQFILLEIGLYVLRIASIHTPNTLSSSLGIIGGLLLSEFAVKVGWITPETVLYMAIASICTFASPSIEFSLCIIIFRMMLLLLTGFFNLTGFLIGLGYILFLVFTTKTFHGFRYTWPLYPFNAQALSNILFRKPILEVKRSGQTNKK